MKRFLVIAAAVLTLASCGAEDDLSQPPEPLGDFRLGHNIAIADNVIFPPEMVSRKLGEVELEAAVQNAVAKRLRRYDGDGLYHLGIVVGAVALAQPGIPVVYAPNSIMLLDVSIFDNSTQKRLNEKPERIQVGEGIRNAVPIIGSGMVRTPEEQLANLAENAARAIEDWLRDNPEWFTPKPGQVRVPYDIQTPAPDVDAARPAEPAN